MEEMRIGDESELDKLIKDQKDQSIIHYLQQEMAQKDKERYQHITFESMKRNFEKVFGFEDDNMAEMLFRYMSDCRVDPRKQEYLNHIRSKDKTGKNTLAEAYDTDNDIWKMRVNFWTFLQKFDAIWQKKPPVYKNTERSLVEQEKYQAQLKHNMAQNELIYKMFDIDGDGQLSILDLEWLSHSFPSSTPLGKSVKQLHETYLEKNLRPKYIKQKQVFNFQLFLQLTPNIKLINDLEFAFNVRIPHQIKLKDCLERYSMISR